MNIEIKDNRVVVQLSEISYGECFEVNSSDKNYTDDFAGKYFMKIKGADPNNPENIMFVNIQYGETHSLPRPASINPLPARVEVKL